MHDKRCLDRDYHNVRLAKFFDFKFYQCLHCGKYFTCQEHQWNDVSEHCWNCGISMEEWLNKTDA